MISKPIRTEYFVSDGRGEWLIRWITSDDLLLPGVRSSGVSTRTGDIAGAQYGADGDLGWIRFHGRQVIQIVPEEVHSYWHLKHVQEENTSGIGIWDIENSEWMASFNQRHLASQEYHHYVIAFYDDIVEVICRELIFGEGNFDIQIVVTKDPRFKRAYLEYARDLEKQGNLQAALEYYQKYVDADPESEDAEHGRRCVLHVKSAIARLDARE